MSYIVIKLCPACGEEFRQRSQNMDGRKYCSTRCRKAQMAVDRWNAKYPVGAPVTLLDDSGETVKTATCSLAYVLGSGAPVIWVNGVTSYCALERCKPIKLSQ